MKTTTQKIGAAVLAAGLLSGAVQAEFGIGAGNLFGCKASFQSEDAVQARNTDPGADAAGIDHFYDDGYNRVASGLPTYWGYDNASQYDPLGDSGNGTITMNSAQTTIDTAKSTVDGDRQSSVRIYWQSDFSSNKVWNVGVRATLRWQQLDIEERSIIQTTIETLSDEYSLNGAIPPTAPFDGSFTGPNILLSNDPDRTFSSAAGPALVGTRKLDGDLFGLDLGPTLGVALSEKVRFVGSAGGTIAWVDSDFAFADGTLDAGSVDHAETLFGLYTSADLQFQVGDRWGLSAGVAYTLLEDYETGTAGRTAELDFGGFSAMGGIYFR